MNCEEQNTTSSIFCMDKKYKVYFCMYKRVSPATVDHSSEDTCCPRRQAFDHGCMVCIHFVTVCLHLYWVCAFLAQRKLDVRVYGGLPMQRFVRDVRIQYAGILGWYNGTNVRFWYTWPAGQQYWGPGNTPRPLTGHLVAYFLFPWSAHRTSRGTTTRERPKGRVGRRRFLLGRPLSLALSAQR